MGGIGPLCSTAASAASLPPTPDADRHSCNEIFTLAAEIWLLFSYSRHVNKGPHLPSLKHLEHASDFCSCQIFVFEGRAKHTHAVVCHDPDHITVKLKVRGKQLFKTIFIEIGAICESKTAARRILGSVGQPAAASRTQPCKSSSGKLHLWAVGVRKRGCFNCGTQITIHGVWKWYGGAMAIDLSWAHSSSKCL